MHESIVNQSSSTRGLEVTANYSSDPQPIDNVVNTFEIICIIFSIFGILGNGFALTVLLYYKPLRSKIHNLFLINHCAINLALSLLLPVNRLTSIISISNAALCYLWQSPIFRTGLYISSSYSIAALAFERYVEIVHPIFYKTNVAKRQVYIELIFMWLLGPALKAAVVLPGTRFENGICYVATRFTSTASRRAAGLLNIVLEFLLPLMIITFFYTSTGLSLRRKVHPSVKHSTRSNNSEIGRARRNILLTLALVVTCFVVCTSFRQFLLLLFYIDVGNIDTTDITYSVSDLLANVSCSVYPYICFYRHDDFKKGMRALLLVFSTKCPAKGTANIDTELTNSNFTEETSRF